MSRIRTIKPEFWDDEKIASISRDARLTFIGMWNLSDDYGVVKGNPLWLKNRIYPYDEIKISQFQAWLTELENIKVVLPFDANSEKYYYIKHFQEHQVINRPSSQARNPSPPGDINEHSVSTHGALSEHSHQEGKGREGKGEGREESHEPSVSESPVSENLNLQVAKNLASFLLSEIRKRKPDFNPGFNGKDLARWSEDIERMIRIDKRDSGRIREVISWCQSDPFWCKNILSGMKLREKFDRLTDDMNPQKRKPVTHSGAIQAIEEARKRRMITEIVE